MNPCMCLVMPSVIPFQAQGPTPDTMEKTIGWIKEAIGGPDARLVLEGEWLEETSAPLRLCAILQSMGVHQCMSMGGPTMNSRAPSCLGESAHIIGTFQYGNRHTIR